MTFCESVSRRRVVLMMVFLLSSGISAVGADRRKPAEILADSFKEVRFFESSYYATPFKERAYRTRFIQSMTRYINWELNFELEPLGYRLDFKVIAVCRDEKGKTIFKQKKDSYIDKGWTTPWTSQGFGSKAGGGWAPGTYTVTFSVKGRQLAEASFTVLADDAVGVKPATLWDGSVPLLPGSRVVKLGEMIPTSTMCSSLVESPRDKMSTWYYYRYAMPARGWTWDKGLLAEKEDGSLQNENMWGLLNFTRDGRSLTMIILSDKKTGTRKTRVDMTLLNHRAGLSAAEAVRRIPRIVVNNPRMNERFTAGGWALTVKSAKVEGKEIVKQNNFTNRKYVFSGGDPNLYLVRVTVELEQLNGKPIKQDFLVKAMVAASDGKSYSCVGAGTAGDYSEYYDMRKGGNQSILMPTIAKSDIEYVFALPLNAAVKEFVWPGFAPIPILVK